MKKQLLKGWLPGLAVLLQLSACAYTPVAEPGAAFVYPDEVQACRQVLGGNPGAGSEMDAGEISLFNWNVRKKRARGWQDDFDAYGDQADLVLFQEASISESTIAELDSSRHWSFAPGYSKKGEITGVMTMSGTEPLARCSLVHYEPWLRTPKATSITEYGLTGTDQTLVVVNVHAINFTFGTAEFERQFGDIQYALAGHDGPVILSGDLNTWRKKRMQIVEDRLASMELDAIAFETDNRVRIFGSALDHVFVRGLKTLQASTEVVSTSDHNPMSVVLSL